MKVFLIFILICVSSVIINTESYAQDANGNDIPDACEPNIPGRF